MDLIKGKLKTILQLCIYEISTGKWPPGSKLPSLRKAEKSWGVNRLTILGAYKELEAMGLVISKDRSGYFVSMDTASVDIKKQKLDALYVSIKDHIEKNVAFDLVASLKYFTSRAEQEAAANPRLAFIECSDFQARGHAKEIEDKLGIPVVPITLGKHEHILNSKNDIRILFTTGFHLHEVTQLGKKYNKQVIHIPIEITPDLFSRKTETPGHAAIVELEKSMSESINRDLKALAGDLVLHKEIVADSDDAIEQFLTNSEDELILLSPRVWGRIDERWHDKPEIRPIEFKIKGSSWPTLLKAANLSV